MKTPQNMSELKKQLRTLRNSPYYVQDPRSQNESGMVIIVCLISCFVMALVCLLVR